MFRTTQADIDHLRILSKSLVNRITSGISFSDQVLNLGRWSVVEDLISGLRWGNNSQELKEHPALSQTSEIEAIETILSEIFAKSSEEVDDSDFLMLYAIAGMLTRIDQSSTPMSGDK